jgi:hypothetical protein
MYDSPSEGDPDSDKAAGADFLHPVDTDKYPVTDRIRRVTRPD